MHDSSFNSGMMQAEGSGETVIEMSWQLRMGGIATFQMADPPSACQAVLTLGFGKPEIPLLSLRSPSKSYTKLLITGIAKSQIPLHPR